DASFNSDVSSLFPRINPPGSIGPPAKAFSGTITSDGRLIVQVFRPATGGVQPTCTLVAFNPGGGIDTSFGTGGFVDPHSPSPCRIDRFLDDDSIRVLRSATLSPALQYSSDGV